jgi:hypothetical protein
MPRVSQFEHAFVDRFPTPLEPGVLYLAMPFNTAAHLCACGCGTKVVTPLSPAAWVLTFDGDTISLSPSIGNGRIPCRSHYFIRNNRVRWAAAMSDQDSRAAQRRDADARAAYYGTPAAAPPDSSSSPEPRVTGRRWWRRLGDWFR